MRVLLEKGVWLLCWPEAGDGDPPRTLNENEAYEFDNIEHAKRALRQARAYRPFENAVFVDDFF